MYLKYHDVVRDGQKYHLYRVAALLLIIFLWLDPPQEGLEIGEN